MTADMYECNPFEAARVLKEVLEAESFFAEVQEKVEFIKALRTKESIFEGYKEFGGPKTDFRFHVQVFMEKLVTFLEKEVNREVEDKKFAEGIGDYLEEILTEVLFWAYGNGVLDFGREVEKVTPGYFDDVKDQLSNE